MGLARSRYVHQFSNEAITLQQVLSQNGYKTSLILSGDHTNFYGLARAFGPVDHYWDSSFSDGYVNDDRDVLKQISALSKWKRAPTFLQIHLMSSHALGLRLAAFEKYHPAENYARPAPLRAGFSQQSFANYYDNGVLQLDWVIGAITAELRAKGYLEDALMVITSDHGELLGEHGLYGHANALLQPAIRVPLILTRYGYEPSKDTFASWGSQVDIAPTILAEIGVPAPEGWSGQPLQHASGREAIFFQQGAEAGLLDTSDPEHLWKFWVDYKNNQHYLFDVTRDPKETVNLTETASSTKTPDWLLKLLPAANTVFH